MDIRPRGLRINLADGEHALCENGLIFQRETRV